MRQPKPKIEIRVGQVWRDKDRRRQEDGNVREMTVAFVNETMITVDVHHGQEPELDWRTMFQRSRFGSGRANDSFELVSEPEATKSTTIDRKSIACPAR
jgi:hypothetical protein